MGHPRLFAAKELTFLQKYPLAAIQKLYTYEQTSVVQQTFELIEANKPFKMDPLYGALAFE